jgi:hypothetical protein
MTWISPATKPPGIEEEVEVLRDYGCKVQNPSHAAYGKRYAVERSAMLSPGVFGCDLVSTGYVLYWRALSDSHKGDDLPDECH